MQATKLPVFSTYGQALTALFRARTHLHPVTVTVFLVMVAVICGVLLSAVGGESVEIFNALNSITALVVPALAVFGFWCCRRFRLRPMGERRPVVAFVQTIAYWFMLLLMMASFAIMGALSIRFGAYVMGMETIGVGSPAYVAKQISQLAAFAVPVGVIGFLIMLRLLPGMAIAARGEGFSVQRSWAVLRGNFWRFVGLVVLFNITIGLLRYAIDYSLAFSVFQVIVERDFSVPLFYVYLASFVVVNLWNVAGMSFILSRSYDLASGVGQSPVAEPVIVKAEKPAVAAKATAKPAAKVPAQKAAAKKPAAKKVTAKKAAAKPAAAKKPVAKKAAVKKKAPAKKK